jgi:SAM-dependent methyltransferase
VVLAPNATSAAFVPLIKCRIVRHECAERRSRTFCLSACNCSLTGRQHRVALAITRMGIVQRVRRLVEPARRRVSAAIYRALYGWPAPPLSRPHEEQALLAVAEALLARWARYRADSVDLTISEHDEMFVAGHLPHYLFVGTSALEIISEAMLLARKTSFRNLLEVPCGYGRITRHLVKFFSDSEIFVSEIDKVKQKFCASTFGVKEIGLPPDFSGDPACRFDLIFVGSLLTHLNASLCVNVLRYLVKALSERGLLIFTTSGRYATTVAAGAGHLEPRTLHNFLGKGFGYEGSPSYGDSRMAPSWVLRTLESMPDVRVLGHKEQGWALLQDAFVIEKASGWTWSRHLRSRWP